MSSERYVLLGLAPPRSNWFDAVLQWSSSAAIPAEFIKCVSVEEVRARLASGRPVSALVVDAATPGLDRDLADAAAMAGATVIVVRDRYSPLISTRDTGITAELDIAFSRDDLLDVLGAHSRPVGRGDMAPSSLIDPVGSGWLGQLFSVCGSGGTGASTIAMALAQGMSSDTRNSARVLLADLALRADQGMLHDAVELGPGLQELVEAHRLANPDPEEVRRMTFEVPRRGYRLLAGLRQPKAWAGLRPRSVDAAIDGLRRAFRVVVADVTGDFEGEADSGSADVQERNHLARSAVLRSSVVVAVGSPGIKGVYSLSNLIRSLVDAGVVPARILPVVNKAPRNPRSRAEIARSLASLLEPASSARPPGAPSAPGRLAVASPLAIPERKLEDAIRDGTPLPAAVVDPVTRGVYAVADRLADLPPATVDPERIVPGSLATWSDSDQIGTGNI